MLKDLHVYFQRIDDEIIRKKENIDATKIHDNLIEIVKSHIEVFE